MDGINLLNASRVMTTCRKDGRVLKPDRPVSTMDTCFLSEKPVVAHGAIAPHVKPFSLRSFAAGHFVFAAAVCVSCGRGEVASCIEHPPLCVLEPRAKKKKKTLAGDWGVMKSVAQSGSMLRLPHVL
jgi:hypothetical protein